MPPRLHLTEQTEREILRAYANNLPVATIAAQFGVSDWTVNRLRRQHGLKRYTPRAGEPVHPTLRKMHGLPPLTKLGHRVDALGEKVSILPGVTLFACPNCGGRSTSPQGHDRCREAA